MTDRPSGAPRAFENRTLREQVFEHLREEILSDRLAPGTELHEVGLAQSLGVSRGPLREALGRLAAEGLVTIVPRRGAVVTKLTKAEFVEASQVREALESLAVRLAVPRLDDTQRRRLHELGDEMTRRAGANDAHGVFATGRAVQDLFVRASGNHRLQDLYAQLIAQMDRLLQRSHELHGDLEESVAELRALLEAVDAGDAARAARLVEHQGEVAERRLRGLPDELFDDRR